MKIKFILILLAAIFASCSAEKDPEVTTGGGQVVPFDLDEFRIQIINKTGKDKMVKVSKILYNPAMNDTSSDEIIPGGIDRGRSQFVKADLCTDQFAEIVNNKDWGWREDGLYDWRNIMVALSEMYPLSEDEAEEYLYTARFDPFVTYELKTEVSRFFYGNVEITNGAYWLGIEDFESLYVEISDADNTADTIRVYGVDKNMHNFQEKNAVYNMGYFWKGEDIDGTGRCYVMMPCPVSMAVITINGDRTSDIVIEKIMDVIE